MNSVEGWSTLRNIYDENIRMGREIQSLESLKSLEAFEMWRCLRFRGKRTKVPRGKRKILRNYKKIKGAISFWWIRLLFESRTAADGKIGTVKLYEFLKAMRKRNANEQFKEYWVLTEERVESKRPRDLKSKRLFYIIHLCENDGLFVFE